MLSQRSLELQKVDIQQKGKAKYVIDGEEYFAEEAAIKTYEDLGYNALWAENTYWWTIMALLFWDVIFAKVRGAVVFASGGDEIDVDPGDARFKQLFDFTVKTNGMPVDFFTPKFYERRKSLIKNRIQELRSNSIEHLLSEAYKSNYGKTCRPIEDWSKYSLDELLVATQQLDSDKLLKLLERLIDNFSDNRAGLPDLIVYRDDDFFFAEVKSERDKVSEKQKEWHSFLSEELGLNIELCLINHTAAQIKKMASSNKVTSKEAIITFGSSTSKKWEEALSFIKQQDTCFTQGEGKQQVHGARFSLSDIEKLYKMLDLTSGWKTQRIEIDGEVVKSTELRDSLWCFREKVKRKASLDYCKKGDYDNKQNKFGCRNLYLRELENDWWEDYGYVDTAKGEWMFDRERIYGEVQERTHRLRFCPLFDDGKITKLLKKLPERINPKVDKDWAFISNDRSKWFWHQNKWMNSFGQTSFPGYNLMVGVQKLDKDDKKNATWLAKNSNITISFETSRGSKSISSQGSKQKSGCFIATAVYGDFEAPQVRTLRAFRNNYMEKTTLGRLFIRIYYRISPPIASHINRHSVQCIFVRKVLDAVVKIIEKANINTL